MSMILNPTQPPADQWQPVGNYLDGAFKLLPVEVRVSSGDQGSSWLMELRRQAQVGEIALHPDQMPAIIISGRCRFTLSLMRMSAAVLCPDIVGLDEEVHSTAPATAPVVN